MSPHKQTSGLRIWLCRDCGQVHLRAPNVMLDFNRREFVSLGSAIVGILRNDFSTEEFESIPNPDPETDGVLFADTII